MKLQLVVKTIQERYSDLNEDIKFYGDRGQSKLEENAYEDYTIAEEEEKELRAKNKGKEGEIFYVQGWVIGKKNDTKTQDYIFARDKGEAEGLIKDLVLRACL